MGSSSARFVHVLNTMNFRLSVTDGPALRSTAMITYANWLLADHNTSYVTNTLWPIIQLDLDYVATWWNHTT